MDVGQYTNYVPGLAVGVILATAMLTGPLLGVADVTDRSGWADVSVDSVPDSIAVEAVNRSTGRIRVDPAVVNVTNRTGSPILVYRVELPDAGDTLMQANELSADGRAEISIEEYTFDRSEIDRGSQPVRISLELRSESRREVVYSSNSTVVIGR